jgi:hypothetical protein
MRAPISSALLCVGLVLAAGTAQAAGTVQVSYVNPDKFADIGWTTWDKEDSLKVLTRHFETMAGRYLADGQQLRIEVLDVDLAGELRPSSRAGHDLRVLIGGADWPRINLRYTLEAAGQPPRRDDVRVTDMNYARRFTSVEGNEPLHAEKRMLDDWFAVTFGPHSAK